MRFLLDAHVPRAIAEFLRALGHEVFLVSERSPPGTPDQAIVADANQLEAIVVTRNRKDFRPLITRDDAKKAQQNPTASLISFNCRLEMWIPMLEEYLAHISLEYDRRQDTADPRIIIEIDHGRITFR